jgi:hypothetical protein
MAKAPGTSKKRGAARLPPPENRNIDLTKFKPDLTSESLKEILTPVRLRDIGLIIFPTIETISPVKTVGLGRTNLTLKFPTLVQTDATPSFASFDFRKLPPNPASFERPVVSVHFDPSKYGLTGNATFVMSFTVEVSGSSPFTLGAFTLPGPVTGVGPRTISGKQTVSLVFNNVPANLQYFGHIEQTGGGAWTWFQTRISYLPILIQG